jgi:hypothetical protein
MTVSGTYVLHYSWGCTGSYGQASITFNSDGTFAGAAAGSWRQREGTLLLSFSSGPAKYGGTVNGNVGSGAMSTFAGLDGCWYLTKQGTIGVAESTDRSAGQAADVAGGGLADTGATSSSSFDAAGNRT